MGAILKKMAVFFKENALRVNGFLDGGDLEENGCFQAHPLKNIHNEYFNFIFWDLYIKITKND